MNRYLLFLNGKAIKSYSSLKRARNGYVSYLWKLKKDDCLELRGSYEGTIIENMSI